MKFNNLTNMPRFGSFKLSERYALRFWPNAQEYLENIGFPSGLAVKNCSFENKFLQYGLKFIRIITAKQFRKLLYENVIKFKNCMKFLW